MATTVKVEGKKMVITTDITGTELSASGKNILRASTGGFISVEGTPYKVAVNVIESAKKPVKAN